mmetsp:Transcript_22300/g.41583  ORF Transcript_22300/g.41583 Transcript_22300/m.41583 type:complete len:81 (-) Transcript_22300:211-453(-)
MQGEPTAKLSYPRKIPSPKPSTETKLQEATAIIENRNPTNDIKRTMLHITTERLIDPMSSFIFAGKKKRGRLVGCDVHCF